MAEHWGHGDTLEAKFVMYKDGDVSTQPRQLDSIIKSNNTTSSNTPTFSFAATDAIGLLGSASAHTEKRDAQQIHLKFHAGPAGYELDLPTDGSLVNTKSDLNINIIDIPHYNYKNYHFNFSGPAASNPPALTPQVDEHGVQQLVVGPPAVIASVSFDGFA